MDKIRRIAMHDMSEAGISPRVLDLEKEILDFTAKEENQPKPDFRKYNGGHYNKSKLLKK